MLTLSKLISDLPEDEFRQWLTDRYPAYASQWKKFNTGKRNPVKPKKEKKEEDKEAE